MSNEVSLVRVFAPAKINLSLHVTGQRSDGYHMLDSLVAFASIGDRLAVQLGNTLSVTTEGPEAGQVPSDMNNLVLKVAALFDDMLGASFLLEKNLPVASGIGGGSADAAAAFRGLMTYWSDGLVDPKMYDPLQTPFANKLAALGADIPVCLQSVATRMRGIGDLLEPVPQMPQLFCLLLNPRVPVSTPMVFNALRTRENAPMSDVLPHFAGVYDFIQWLKDQRNDLQEPAIAFAPIIGDVLARLDQETDCLLARMSGSGATCFGLFESQDAAIAAGKRIAEDKPEWWIGGGELGSMAQLSLPVVS